MLRELRQEVCQANRDLVRLGLVTLTFGNVSGIDRSQRLIAIKPSGVAYDDLTPDDLVVVDLDGKVIQGSMHPSSDTPTHLVLYRAFPKIGGVTHTHSSHATMFAQACRGIPCFGTTHAGVFYGEVPITRALTEEEVHTDYEVHTGDTIVERFASGDTDRSSPGTARSSGDGTPPRPWRTASSSRRSRRRRSARCSSDRTRRPFRSICWTSITSGSTARTHTTASRTDHSGICVIWWGGATGRTADWRANQLAVSQGTAARPHQDSSPRPPR
jgi:L-ribulose-5-phosphate 4-epimerase